MKCLENKFLDKNIGMNENSNNFLRTKNGKYYYQGQVYTKGKWYRKMSNYLIFTNNTVSLRRYTDEIRTEYIKTFIMKNIRKSTFSMLILPCIMFLLISFGIVWWSDIVYTRQKFLSYSLSVQDVSNINIFAKFIASMFFIFATVFLVKIIFLQEKIIMTGSDKRIRMRHISKKEYNDILNLFRKK